MMKSANLVHPSAETLQAFGLGQLDSFSAEPVRQHLETCPECQLRAQQATAPHGTPTPTKPLSQLAELMHGRPSDGIPVATTLPPELMAHPQYDILRQLGRGGMGVVYLAKNKLMDRMEVLKVINKALMDRPGSLERFLREIRSASQLNHINVVKAYSALPLGDLLVFAMEYVEGEDLGKYVQSHGPLPVVNACYYARQVAAGLQHAHEKGMVHRDIKPQNLVLARDGKKHIVKILDFGLAKISREKGLERDLTGQGWMLGTPDYMAPEQIVDAANADIRADIYSLGCTLYFLLTGTPCFQAKSLLELLQAHQSSEPRPLHLIRQGIPTELNAVVAKMMAKDPAKRYQTPGEVVEALRPFLKPAAKGTEVGSAPAINLAEDTVQAGSRATPRPSSATLPVAQAWMDERIAPAPPQAVPVLGKATLPAGVVAPPVRKGGSPWLWLAAGGVGLLFVGILAAVGIGIVVWNSNHAITGQSTATTQSTASTQTGTATKDTATKDTAQPAPKDGVLVLQQLPAGADVFVDGKRMDFTAPTPGTPLELRADPGSHVVEVRKTGYKNFTTTVTVTAGGRAPVQINLAQLPLPTPTLIVLEKFPAGAEVFLDGIQVAVKPPGPSGSVEIPTGAGNKKLEVRKAGYKPFITNVALVSGSRLPIQVSMEVIPIDPPGKAVAGQYHYKAEDVAKYMNAAVIRVTNLADKANSLKSYGYESGVSILGGWVEEKKSLTVTYNLIAGVEYLFLAGGDADAVDVDLDLLDANNTVVAQDNGVEPDAIITYTPPANGKYTLRMTLFQSKNNVPCVCVLAVLKKNGWKVPVHNLDKAMGKIMKGMELVDKALFDKQGKKIDLFQGSGQWAFYGGALSQGENMSMTNLTFGSGERLFVGVGDDFAQVIKLQLEDNNNNKIKTDTVSSPTSVLDYNANGAMHGLRLYNTQSSAPTVVLMAVFDVYTPKK